MNRKFGIALAVVLVAVVVLGVSLNTKQTYAVADKVYTYEKEGFGGDFCITINTDGTFSYYEGFLSSYIGMGEWTLNGDMLTLSEENGRVNHFKVDGGDLVFRAEGSSNFIYLKTVDGERFAGSPQ